MFLFEIRKALNGYILLLDNYETAASSSRKKMLVFEEWGNLIKYLQDNEVTLNIEYK